MDEQGRCGLCQRGLTGFDGAYSFGSYEGELRALIHLFKYGKVQTLARPLGRFLRQALPRELRFDLIVPMPMHWKRRWERGFNQAELLALEISRGTRIPVANPVRRIHHKAVQAGLTNAKRRANVEGAFHVKRRKSLLGKRVLLIDDVMTTGATAGACSKALKRAGASHVTLLTVARVDRRVLAHSRDLFPESIFSGSLEDAKSGSFA